MKKLFLFILFIIAFVVFIQIRIFAQEPKSIFQIEYENHKNIKHEISLFKDNGEGIIPLKNIGKDLNATIYGYLPDWEYATAKSYLNYDLLTHISAFDFVVSSDGSVTNPSGWPWTDIINNAHAKGVKVIMTAVYFDAAGIHTLLTTTSAKLSLISNIISKIITYQLDGVNIDFESMNSADRGTLLNTFMLELTQTIHTQLPGKEVSFAGPAVNWGGWDLAGLASSCDYIFIMGYDFYGSWSINTGPGSPLTGGNYNISNTINSQYGAVIRSTPNRIILGIPYYGQKWKAKDSLPYSKIATTDYVGSTRFKDDVKTSKTYGLLWDGISQTPWYRYQSGGTWYQVWFDNDSSLGLKYQIAQSKKLKGVGMWALGYDGDRPELWNGLRKWFYNQSLVQNNNNLSYGFRLNQNYPNPFNPVTIISYQLPMNNYVILNIYDVLGKEIAKLLGENQTSGFHETLWNTNGAPSGIYYYKIQAGSFTDIKKMILLK